MCSASAVLKADRAEGDLTPTGWAQGLGQEREAGLGVSLGAMASRPTVPDPPAGPSAPPPTPQPASRPLPVPQEDPSVLIPQRDGLQGTCRAESRLWGGERPEPISTRAPGPERVFAARGSHSLPFAPSRSPHGSPKGVTLGSWASWLDPMW